MNFSCCIDSPVGLLTVVSDERAVMRIRFGRFADDSAAAATVQLTADPAQSADALRSAVSAELPDAARPKADPRPTAMAPEVLRQAVRELAEYFAGERQIFTVPVAPAGTPFQQQVWAALQRIPYGATCSYRAIAEAVGNPKACRAVGMANHRNPIPILIPCHRVVGANGALTGYASGLKIKSQLLQLESAGRGDSLFALA